MSTVTKVIDSLVSKSVNTSAAMVSKVSYDVLNECVDRVRKMNKGATVPMSGGFKVAFVHAV